MKFVELLLQEAVEIIKNPDVSKILSLLAYNIKCGQLFLYSCEGHQHKKKVIGDVTSFNGSKKEAIFYQKGNLQYKRCTSRN